MESMETGYNSSHTGAKIDAAVSAVSERAALWDAKQDRIQGSAGQLVGFDAQGGAVACDRPSYTASDVGAVPTTRTVNGKALSSDITLTAANVSAVPTTRKVNGKALSSDVTLAAADVGAAESAHTHTKSEISDFPTSLPASDVSSWAKASAKPTYTASEVGALSSSGTAAAATKLATTRTIDGVSFNGTAAITHYATCSTAAATAAKTASLTGFSLVTGARVAVKFTVTNTAANPTLNINSTGAKAIYYRGAAIDAGYLAADRTYEFIYNGTQYELVGDINTDTTQTSITGNAATATKLQTSRTIRTNLASTSTASFNGTANVTPGVTGTLGIANGGTGATTAEGALTSLGAAASAHTHTKSEISDFPASLPASDVYSWAKASVKPTYTASEVGALSSSGTAAAATKLATSRTLDGVSFNGTAAITHYATCSTAAATAAKTASLTGFSLVTGARVAVKFTVTNTAANPTLNINSTGAKSIYYRGAAISAGYLAANRTYEFIYNGTQYDLVGDINTDTTQTTITGNAGSATKLATARTIDGVSFDGSAAISRYATCSTASATVAKTASLTGFSLVTGARVTVKFQNANTAFAPTLNIGGTGAKKIVFGSGSTMSGATTEDTLNSVMIWDEGAVLDFVYDGTNWIIANRGRGTGRDMLGVTVEYPKDTNRVCTTGDEVFNDYRKRTYDSTGEATQGNIAAGGFAHAEGGCCSAVDVGAHAEGWCNIAGAFGSHVEGGWTKTLADAVYAHVEGYGNQTSSPAGHVEGAYSASAGDYSHAEGYNTRAMGFYSHSQNRGTRATALAQTAMGQYNIVSSSDTDRVIVGKGTSDTARANCFRITSTGVYATGNYNASGADYAEMFEWSDANPEAEDRAGLFVTLDGEKIRIAAPDDDYILGIVSGNPSVVGDVYDEQWKGMYLYDVFGRPLWEDVDVPEETVKISDPLHPGEKVTKVIAPAYTEHCQKRNPDYIGDTPYQKRTERKEWDAVGLLGKLVAVDDGTCVVNGYCTVADGGIATASETRTKYRVMARLDDTHIRIMIL